MPHGFCISWRPGLLWTLVLSDAAIALSYFAIPAALYAFTRRHPNLPDPLLLFFFCAFIVACGTTHVLEVVNMWRPFYHVLAGAKVSTAVVSAATAFLVWPMLAQASRLIDERATLQQQLSVKNEALAAALAESERRQAAVERSDKALRTTIMSAPIGMAMVSLQGTFLMVNNALCQMLGYAASELERMTFQEITYAEDLDVDLLHVASLIDGLTSSYRMEKRYVHKDGRIVHVQLDVVLIRDASSAPSHFISQIQDITVRKQMESALLETRHRYRTLLDNLPTAVVVHRADTTIEYANPVSSQLLGLTQDQLLGRTAMDPAWRFVRENGSEMALDDYPVMMVSASGAPLRAYVTGVVRGKDASPAWLLVNAFPLMTPAGSLDRIIVSFIDISDRRALERELAQQARTDGLTGLRNRRAFEEDINFEVARHRRSGRPLSLVIADLDHFKRINDTWGHGIGDSVLRTFAEICRRSVREGDIACRFGGEEFAILLPDTELGTAAAIADRLRVESQDASVSLPGSAAVTFSISAGVAELMTSDVGTRPLMKRADTALYKAKSGGRNRVEVAAVDPLCLEDATAG